MKIKFDWIEKWKGRETDEQGINVNKLDF